MAQERVWAVTEGDKPCILLTGGTGYIGVHVAVALLEAGYEVVIVDNLANSYPDVLDRIEGISGRRPTFVRSDVRDETALDLVFTRHDIGAVIHLAGLKSAPESVAEPLVYHAVNLGTILSLLAAMDRHGCRRLIFSSSASVYGPSDEAVCEDMPARPASPYAWTKLAGERIISDVAAVHPELRAMSLRYFNPVGAHPGGLIGERGRARATSLFPVLMEAAECGRALPVYGTDWPTRDGSCVRDFVHICDIAEGHVAALQALFGGRTGSGHQIVNLGSGDGVTVLEAIHAFECATGRPVDWSPAPRRPGDIGFSVADATRAERLLGWTTRRGLGEMCRDALRWHRAQPPALSQAGQKRGAGGAKGADDPGDLNLAEPPMRA